MPEAAENMVRTQVHFTAAQLRRARTLAAGEGVSFAELVRRALDAYPPTFGPEEEEALEALARAVLQSKDEADAAMARAVRRLDDLERHMEERRRGDS
jgi:hypothetical protein